MTIDIQPGDTFTIKPSGSTYQYRNGKYRSIGNRDWYGLGRDIDEQDLNPTLARQIITAAGHTITETPPPPTPVPWPTHAVINRDDGCIEYTGTLDQCVRKADGHRIYEVRPLAPAPLSPAMRAFVEWFTDAGYQAELRNIARNLLAEGGAQ